MAQELVVYGMLSGGNGSSRSLAVLHLFFQMFLRCTRPKLFSTSAYRPDLKDESKDAEALLDQRIITTKDELITVLVADLLASKDVLLAAKDDLLAAKDRELLQAKGYMTSREMSQEKLQCGENGRVVGHDRRRYACTVLI